MTTDNQSFKYNIGQTVSGSKPMIGKVYGVITGRTVLNMGSKLYWIKSGNGIEYKLLEHQIR